MRGAWCSTLILSSALLVACANDQGLTNRLVSDPQFFAANVKGYAETAAGLPPEITYGWNVTVAGDEARWRECTATDEAGQPPAAAAIPASTTCSGVERRRARGELLGIEKVGETVVDGHEVDVVRLSLAPRPAYIVPTHHLSNRPR